MTTTNRYIRQKSYHKWAMGGRLIQSASVLVGCGGLGSALLPIS
jgi:hypothetical protein